MGVILGLYWGYIRVIWVWNFGTWFWGAGFGPGMYLLFHKTCEGSLAVSKCAMG